jgi:ketosteroid isomerase-like protein
MLKSISIVVCIAVFSAALFGKEKGTSKHDASGAPDKAYMQQIWDGWSTLDPANVAQYYAQGPHVFFDIAPMKYGSWNEYEKGVKEVLANYQSGACKVNDDAQVHAAGTLVWGTATVMCDLMQKSGKHDMSNFRWTVIWEKQNGKWLTVHEHVSEPMAE